MLLRQVGEIAAETKVCWEFVPEGLNPVEEKALVAKARRGDTRAFEELIAHTSRRIFSLLNRMLDDPTAIEDVAQNTYLKAWTGLHKFRGKSLFSTWLYRIATNEALGHMRKVSRRRKWEVECRDGVDFGMTVKGHDDLIVDTTAVRRAMSMLPHAYRTAISLSYMEDMKYEEAATVMEVPLNTYKTYLHRGKMKLREILEGNEV